MEKDFDKEFRELQLEAQKSKAEAARLEEQARRVDLDQVRDSWAGRVRELVGQAEWREASLDHINNVERLNKRSEERNELWIKCVLLNLAATMVIAGALVAIAAKL